MLCFTRSYQLSGVEKGWPTDRGLIIIALWPGCIGAVLYCPVCVCWKGCTWALAENHNHDRSGKGAVRQHIHTGWRTERTRTRRWPWWPRWGSRNRKTVHQPSRVHGWCTVRSKSLHLEAPRALKNAGRHRLPVGGGNVSKFVVT